MPYYATSQEWLHQSSLLIEARPSTTRITTKYHISKPTKSRRSKKPLPTSTTTTSSTTTAPTHQQQQQQQPRGSLTLKTYDAHSGVCLKYRTTKAAEVSRLILSLGQPLGARMAALPLPETGDQVMADAPAGEESAAAAAAAAAGKKGEDKEATKAGGSKAQTQTQAQAQGQQGGGGGGGAKGKKKRGKK
ncbi:hypothetical protein AAE478_003082 [Parahypoxylon ruwenzoriense]